MTSCLIIMEVEKSRKLPSTACRPGNARGGILVQGNLGLSRVRQDQVQRPENRESEKGAGENGRSSSTKGSTLPPSFWLLGSSIEQSLPTHMG